MISQCTTSHPPCSPLTSSPLSTGTDLYLQVQEGDPESSTGLSRALFIQCSQLAGQVAIMLRCLCASLTSAIDANSKATSTMGGKALTKGGAGAGGTVLDPNAPYLSGLLLVGRLSWLLKIRGRFLEEALSSTPLSSAAPTPDSVAGIAHCASPHLIVWVHFSVLLLLITSSISIISHRPFHRMIYSCSAHPPLTLLPLPPPPPLPSSLTRLGV
jgi:hypothetical protein